MSEQGLCCCEYENEVGERTSILACCCDCQAVDETFDRLLQCKKVPDSNWIKMLRTISDRCRMPWIGGAMHIRSDIAIPIMIIPAAIVVASLSETATFIVLSLMPAGILLAHQCWRRSLKRNRSQLFFAWGMTSVFTVIYAFSYIILSFREVFLWECLLVFTLIALTFYSLYLTKQDPGVIRAQQRRRSKKHRVKKNGIKQNGGLHYPQNGFAKHPEDYHKERRVFDFVRDNLGYTSVEEEIDKRQRTCSTNCDHENEHPHTYSGEEEKRTFSLGEDRLSYNTLETQPVDWVDSRMNKDGCLQTWCEKCNIKMPPRAGHCNVCNVCVMGRDHHCVWIDQCIGERNHQAFFASLVLFVISSCYSMQLSLTTVCTPTMYLDWFLVPNDCRFVYGDFQTAVVWVCVCYSSMALCLIVLALVQQFITISQNLTLVEFNKATARGWNKFYLIVTQNVNNRGFLKNWKEFLGGRRAQSYGSEIV